VITLADLAALHQQYADLLAAPVEPVRVPHDRGDVVIGDAAPTLMSCINLSRDSTYRESVAFGTDDAVRMGRIHLAQGARVLDVGAESSVDGAERVRAADQRTRLVPVVEALAAEAVVSVETYEPSVVEACLAAGARVLNMTGREHEERMLALAAEHDAAVVMCFGESPNVRDIADVPPGDDPFPALLDPFGPRVERARALGVARLVIDPGVGFTYRNLTTPVQRAAFQTRVLAQTFRLRPLGVPVCNALPHSHELFGDEFRKAEGFYAVLAALGGTHLMRVHEVAHLRAVLGAMESLSVR